ncbi:hypothetical protein AAG570_003134 [Ranatra chinensis]|uniref:CMP/dCMP-type deaminase domain-containing protein n=1 Tax=Ranatra chinensis TaxID=642074 RepID=A0ABD0Y5V7_9HEMI
MERALELAERALAKGEVPVGCIFVRGSCAIATGANDVNRTKNATRHAEMDCVDKVLKSGDSARDCNAHLTVEPCAMCAAALLNLKVERLIYGCPNDRFGGCGSVVDVAALLGSQIPIISAVLPDRAMALLKQFYAGTNPNAPLSKVKTKKPK